MPVSAPSSLASGNLEQPSCSEALSRLLELQHQASSLLHPQHHLLRLLHFLAMKMTQPVFSAEYAKAFGQRSVQKVRFGTVYRVGVGLLGLLLGDAWISAVRDQRRGG